MKKSFLAIIFSFVVIASLGFLFLDNYNPGNEIVNQLHRDDIQAIAMLSIDNDWGNEQSAFITESFFVNDMLTPKIEIKFDPENPNYSEMSINLSNAIKEHLKNYNSTDIAVIVIGLEDNEDLNIAIYGDNLKLSELVWVWITQ